MDVCLCNSDDSSAYAVFIEIDNYVQGGICF